MGLINPPYAPTLQWQRPTEDADGNAVYNDTGQYQTVVEPTGQGIDTGTGRRRGQIGLVYVPRGSDVKIGDRFPFGGQYCTVTSYPRGDQDHVFTGDDFGWVEYDFAGPVTRWS